MNLAILKPEVQEFISKNLKIEITKIILKGSPYEDIESKVLANQILAKKNQKKNYLLGSRVKTYTIQIKFL